jgi:hypothetical protein
MRRYADYVVDPTNSNAPVANAQVTVYDAGTVNLATLYSDDGVTPVGNPVTADSYGRFFFFIASGKYDLLYTASGFTPVTEPSVQIVDFFEANAGDAALVQSDVNPTSVGGNTPGAITASSLIVGTGVALTSTSAAVRYFNTITTTAAASDVLSVPGMTSGGHAFWVALNSAAATMVSLSLTPGTNNVTLFHPATAGAQFAIFGSFS